MSLIEKTGRELKEIYQRTVDKLDSLKGTPQSIAAGFATGVAVSFTPFVGFHILLALSLAKICRQNGVAAALGTIAGNPWTFPLIWYMTLHTGHFLLRSAAPKLPVNFKHFFSELFHAVITLDFSAFLSDIWPVLFPMFVGCIPFFIGIWLLLPKLILQVLKNSRNKGDNNDSRTRM